MYVSYYNNCKYNITYITDANEIITNNIILKNTHKLFAVWKMNTTLNSNQTILRAFPWKHIRADVDIVLLLVEERIQQYTIIKVCKLIILVE